RFGWACARLDDAANLLPARVTALLAAALAPAAGGSARQALHVLRRDGAAHPSPNAGRCEAAFAGALGVRLGGTNTYAGTTERRGTLGDGPPPSPADITRAVRLSRLVIIAATVLSAVIAQLVPDGISDRCGNDHVLWRWLSQRSLSPARSRGRAGSPTASRARPGAQAGARAPA